MNLDGKKKSVPTNNIWTQPLLTLFTGSFGALSRCPPENKWPGPGNPVCLGFFFSFRTRGRLKISKGREISDGKNSEHQKEENEFIMQREDYGRIRKGGDSARNIKKQVYSWGQWDQTNVPKE